MLNRQIIFKSRPEGIPSRENFEIMETPIPHLEQGQILLKSLYLSVDPYMRERMTEMKSYIAPFQLGGVITGTLIGRVVDTEHNDFQIGDVVSGFLGWQDYNLSDGSGLKKLSHIPSQIPYHAALGILGSPGITAYLGLLETGTPKPGETVVISGAGGAVGSLVAQIAKIIGCRVIGIVGSDSKVSYLQDELGLDGVINYKKSKDIEVELSLLCPNGIDIYFDNVGNEILNAVSLLLNYNARIILCGQISQYNGDLPSIDPRILGRITKSSAKILGFLIRHCSSEQVNAALDQLMEWILEGKLNWRVSIVEGLEHTPDALIGLFLGTNIGKQLVKLE